MQLKNFPIYRKLISKISHDSRCAQEKIAKRPKPTKVYQSIIFIVGINLQIVVEMDFPRGLISRGLSYQLWELVPRTKRSPVRTFGSSSAWDFQLG